MRKGRQLFRKCRFTIVLMLVRIACEKYLRAWDDEDCWRFTATDRFFP